MKCAASWAGSTRTSLPCTKPCSSSSERSTETWPASETESAALGRLARLPSKLLSASNHFYLVGIINETYILSLSLSLYYSRNLDESVAVVEALHDKWQSQQRSWFSSSLADMEHRLLMAEDGWKRLRTSSGTKHRTCQIRPHELLRLRSEFDVNDKNAVIILKCLFSLKGVDWLPSMPRPAIFNVM